MKIRLSISIFIFLLVLSVFANYSILAYKSFQTYKTIVAPQIKFDLIHFKFFLRNELEKEHIRLIAPKVLDDKKTLLKTFHITVSPKDIAKLNSSLPQSGKKYVKGYLRVSDENKIYKIKLRYRGDSNYHWLYAQKSLRIKLTHHQLYNMSKMFNLINPPQVLSYRDSINYNLSKELGIISPITYPCRVFINGKYMGVYMYLSQVDESLLRKLKKMPGSIYYGDGSPIDKKTKIAKLWYDSKYWQKKASRNAEQKANRNDIKFFIQKINSESSDEFNKFAKTYLNLDKFFKFIALDRVLGSQHHDYIHNHKIYFDPYKGKFEPISWDLRFWQNIPQKDLSLYPLQLKLASNPIFDAQIDKISYNLIKNHLFDKIKTSYKTIIDSIYRDLDSDIYKDKAILDTHITPKPISIVMHTKEILQDYNQSLQILKSRFEYLNKLYNNTIVKYKIDKKSKNHLQLILVVSGNSPVKMTISKRLYSKILYKNMILPSSNILYTGRKIVHNSQHTFPKSLYGIDTVKNIPLKYIFDIYNVPLDDILSNITFTNDITSLKIIPKKLHNYNNIKHGFIKIKHTYTKIFKGKVYITHTLSFDKDTTVIIKPNTTFIISPKQSLYFYGKVIAVGTKDKPIKFIPKDKLKPWGLVAIQGKYTSNSRFKYCYFQNGSVDIHNLIHYTAQFNIHNCPNFIVEHCYIGQNYIGDDSMHIAYSTGIVDNSKFENARSDALDIDIAKVKVTNCTFINSGNDALDIMTTKLFASNDTFILTGDKGISVGEWSDANITNSTFENNFIGLEIKDKSKVKAYNLTFINAKNKAINLYNKNPRYDQGGFLEATDIKFIGNSTITADKRSKYVIH